jgi:hypothetical protein
MSFLLENNGIALEHEALAIFDPINRFLAGRL